MLFLFPILFNECFASIELALHSDYTYKMGFELSHPVPATAIGNKRILVKFPDEFFRPVFLGNLVLDPPLLYVDELQNIRSIGHEEVERVIRAELVCDGKFLKKEIEDATYRVICPNEGHRLKKELAQSNGSIFEHCYVHPHLPNNVCHYFYVAVHRKECDEGDDEVKVDCMKLFVGQSSAQQQAAATGPPKDAKLVIKQLEKDWIKKFKWLIKRRCKKVEQGIPPTAAEQELHGDSRQKECELIL